MGNGEVQSCSSARAQVEAVFAFEQETLQSDDLRILIANDLFRMQPNRMQPNQNLPQDLPQDIPVVGAIALLPGELRDP